MTIKMEANTNQVNPVTSKTVWVRGLALTIEAMWNQILIKIGSVLIEALEIPYEGEEAFQSWVQAYKQELSRGQYRFTIPQARTNATDEFVYQTEDGTFNVLSGYATLEWDDTRLTEQELESGRFFLMKTNQTLGTLMEDHLYTVIRFSSSTETSVQTQQTLAEIVQSSQHPEWLMDYLNGRLLIFDEERAVQLKRAQWDPLWVAALNENSAYKPLPTPLTPELKEYYFSKQDLKKRFGYDVGIAKVVPSGYTLKQTKKGQIKVTHYYHSDLVPQSFLCKCGKHPQQTGPLSERICWSCLAMYQENCIQRSAQKLAEQLTLMDSKQALEPVFVVIHTNQGRAEAGMVREMINLCVMNQNQQILFQSLIRPTAILSRNNRERGYQPETLQEAPSFEDIHDAFCNVIRGRLVVFFNAEERRSMYQAYCDQKGLRAEEMDHWICLKEILIPISYGTKRLHKLVAQHGEAWLKESRGLQMECSALGIPFPEEPSIEKDAMMMCQIYRALRRKTC